MLATVFLLTFCVNLMPQRCKSSRELKALRARTLEQEQNENAEWELSLAVIVQFLSRAL